MRRKEYECHAISALIEAIRLRIKGGSRVDREMSLNSPVQQPLARICNSNEPERDVNPLARWTIVSHLDAWMDFNSSRINWRQFAGRELTWQFLRREDI